MHIKQKSKCYLKLILCLAPKDLFPRLLFTFALVIGAAFCNIIAPLILKHIIDTLNSNFKFATIINLFLIYCMVLLLSKVCFECKFAVYAKWEQGLIKEGFIYIYKRIQQSTPEFFKNSMPGAIASRIFQALLGLKSMLFDGISHLLPLVLELILTIITVATIFDFKMAIIVGIGTVFYSVCLILLNNKLLKYQNDIRNSAIEFQGVLTELISRWKDIKLANGYRLTASIFSKKNEEMTEKNKIFYKKRSLLGFLQSLPLSVVFIAANFHAIMCFIQHKNTIGSIILINTYLIQLIKPLETFGVLFRSISRAYSDFISINTILQNEQAVYADKNISETIEILSIKNLNKGNILKDITFTINRGDKIAIIGESGSGKTSLLQVISGLTKNFQGEVLLNTKNIKEFPIDQLYSLISFLPCDAKLLTGTIKQNLLLGDHVDFDRVNEVLASTYINYKIASMDNGLETIVSDETNLLSAGEKQRIKLARTLLIKSQIKILDEATSALDALTEHTIIDNLLSKKEVTIIFSTHKFLHLSKFDKIVHLKKGSIIEIGSHDDLLDNKGEYYKLWKNQIRINL